MAIVKYTNEDGWIEIREVPKDALPYEYEFGILIGPPDLSKIHEDFDIARNISNALVNADLYDFQQLRGRRAELVNVLIRTTGAGEHISPLRNKIIEIYQRDFWPDKFED